ncbi:DNA phosphorothioation-associated protein 4 [Crocosphaera sp. XPORK-15E]|uniref:DNA phosphorothioation-associated protein 4 n=1 Tax=Crocosphaera sp. XPORK-15E TaxID=3110247 RepID=UPI002B2202C8|nr:DNA phosphorothioation-associated protein 4 [Crocosphaera sp. XPORK-15E]MEA5533125.1 DNA phosphorothioation-associated protein 4 [Crocosphaera sp. XPORK-15E]
MAVNRVRIGKDKAELVQSLVDFNGGVGPFQTYADVMIFAATLGAKSQRRVPLHVISKEPAPISLEIFVSRGYDAVIKLLAIAETNNPKILSVYDTEAENERVQIFEEYANGGLEMLQQELKGVVDYSEHILLLLNIERFPQNSSDEEFDLSRFL